MLRLPSFRTFSVLSVSLWLINAEKINHRGTESTEMRTFGKAPLEVYMSEEDLEVLITLDDPWYGPDEDTFHHPQPDTGWPESYLT